MLLSGKRFRIAPSKAGIGGTQSTLQEPGMSARELEIQKLQKEWDTNPRWKNIKRGYTAADVIRLRGSLQVEHTLAKRGAEKLWNLVNNEPFVNTLGALT